MTHLSPLAIVATPRALIRLDGETLLVEVPDGPDCVIPIGLIGGLVIVGRSINCTTAALTGLAERGLSCAFVGTSGRLRAIVAPPSCATEGALRLRSVQYTVESQRAASNAAPAALRLCVRIIEQKLLAIDALLAQHDRSHVDVDLSVPRQQLRLLRSRASQASTIDELRGYEGAASALYWQTLPALFRGELSTNRRTRQPPQDECNAALSFGYGLLLSELVSCIAAAGLEPMLGLLHPPQAHRPSLALDLIEPLRHAIIDRLVVRATNRRELTAQHFEARDGGVFLNVDGRRAFLHLYAHAMASSDTTNRDSPVPVRDLLALAVREYSDALSCIELECHTRAPLAV